MKVKHFAGYGSVEVKKQSKVNFTDKLGNKKTKLILVVKGNHERGIVRDDIFDVKHWIFDKFEKNFKGDEFNIEMSIEDDYIKENGVDVEVAKYTFIY
jgi:hypothetical protein